MGDFVFDGTAAMKWSPRFRLAFVAIMMGTVYGLLPVAGCFAQSQKQPAGQRSIADESLKKFLQNYTSDPQDRTTRYFYAPVDLKGDRKEIIVYLTGPEWCGSGGCTALILSADDSSYRVVTKLTVAQRPIRVLAATSNGWHSLGVWVRGGGVQAGYEAVLSFNGKTYPSNPTLAPRSTAKAEGKIVIPEELKDLKTLYP